MKSKLKKDRWKTYDLNYAKDHEKKNPDTYGEFNQIFKLYKPKSNDKILEIGCNTGEFCYLLKKRFGIVPKGIDINSEAIKIANEKYPQMDFQVKDFLDLEEKYDVIFMQHVIEHLKEPKNALLKLRDLLNSQGKLIITCPNDWAYPSKFFCWIRKMKFCYDPTHVSEFNPRTLSDIVKEAGFHELKVITKPLGIPQLYKISPRIQYGVPSHMFGDFIFILLEK